MSLRRAATITGITLVIVGLLLAVALPALHNIHFAFAPDFSGEARQLTERGVVLVLGAGNVVGYCAIFVGALILTARIAYAIGRRRR
jgi:vancomycin permeability regulator SanA